MGSERNLFEKKEGFCDYCEGVIGVRHGIKGLVVCMKCYQKQVRRGTFERYVGRSEEEIKENKRNYHRKHAKEKIGCYKIKSDYLRALPVDDLLFEVGFFDEDEKGDE